jgi:phage major head subunit gpT-like protein
MEVTAGNLTALFTGFDIIFQRGFQKPPSYYEKIATVVRSTSRQTTYPWLGRTTKFREWLGDRVVQALETHTYTIVNKDFEDTISISRNDIEDDTYGVYEPVIEQLGWDTKVHPDSLLFTMLKNSVNSPPSVVAFDGQPFSPRRIRWGRWAPVATAVTARHRISILQGADPSGFLSMRRERFDHLFSSCGGNMQ